MSINGTAVFAALVGSVLAYSGIKGKSISSSAKALLQGQSPASVAQTLPIGATDTSSTATTGNAPAGDTGAATGSAATNQAIARALAAPYGWSTGQQWTDLVSLWNKESGWNQYADNPTSGAYGIAQALPPTKYPLAGQAAGGSSATVQIAWGLSYIQGRYGSASAAWSHEVANDWY